MKKLFKSGALVLAAAVVMAFASCSNGSSSDDEELVYKTIVDNKNITFHENSLTQLVSAATFAKTDVKSVKIEVKNYVHKVAEYSWITIASDTDWNNKIEFSEYLKTSTSFTYTLTASELKAYIAGGLFIGGDEEATADVTVSIGMTADALAALEEAEKNANNNDLISFPYTIDYTGTGENEVFLTSDKMGNLNVTGLVIVAVSWKAGSGSISFGTDQEESWAALEWTDGIGYKTFSVNTLKSNDLKVWADADVVYTVTVTYTE